jgi:hypothetical protein
VCPREVLDAAGLEDALLSAGESMLVGRKVDDDAIVARALCFGSPEFRRLRAEFHAGALGFVVADREEWEGRRISDRQRRVFAKSGIALPGSSCFIATVADLHNAIRAFGRFPESKRAALKAHIKKRAKAVGAMSHVPRGLAREPADSGAQSFSRHPGTRRASAHVVAAPEGGAPPSARSPVRPEDPVDARLHAAFFEPARTRCGADVWDAAARDGGTLSFEDAIAYALQESRA